MVRFVDNTWWKKLCGITKDIYESPQLHHRKYSEMNHDLKQTARTGQLLGRTYMGHS